MAGQRDTPARRRQRNQPDDPGRAPRARAVTGRVPQPAEGGNPYGRQVDAGARQPAVVASAARIDIGDKGAVGRARTRRQAWQTEAWDYASEVGEIRYTVGKMAAMCSKARLYPATRTSPDSDPMSVEDDDADLDPGTVKTALDVLARLRAPQGGQAAIIRDLSFNFDIAGECYLHGHEDPQTQEEDWAVRSVDELVVTGDRFALQVAPGAKNPEPIPPSDIVIRLWERHPRFGQLADCHMRSVLAECESLLLLSREVRATARSRLSNGILVIPSEASFGPVDPTREQADGEEPEDPFDAELQASMITPIQEEGSASAVVPLVMRLPEALCDKVRHIPLSRPLDAVLDQRIEARIMRIARGLNMPPEVVRGHQETTFANAAVVKQSEFDDHVEPRLVMLCDAITGGYFQWQLVEAGVPLDVARRVFVWYDPSALTADPDQAEKADKAHEDGIISDSARRHYAGFSDEDAPDDAEILRRIVFKVTRPDPTTLAQMLRATNLLPDVLIPMPPGGTIDNPTSPTAPPIVAASRRLPSGGWAHLGRRLTDIDRQLRTRIHVAADQAMRQTLERAGKRIVARVQRAKGGTESSLARVAAATRARPELIAATFGQAVVQGAGITDDELLAGAFDRLADDAGVWIDVAYGNAVSAVQDVTGPLPSGLAEEVKAARAQAVPAATGYLKQSLVTLAGDRLYNPTPGAPQVGEFDPTMTVPVSIVRAAMAIAGGDDPNGGSGGAPLTSANGTPALGVATGPIAMNAVNQGGGGIEGYQWEYGTADRKSFQPHLDLDGTTVTSFDDPKWANDEGWPDAQCWPGDHDGCLCDVIPVIIGPQGQQTVDMGQSAVGDAED